MPALTQLGAGTTPDSLNQWGVTLAQRFAATAQDAITLAKYVDGQGQAGLEVIGFSSDEAVAFQAGADYLKTIAAIIQGTAAQPTDFDFTNALAAFIGPNPQF